jgi:cephalosporin hydroxylase
LPLIYGPFSGPGENEAGTPSNRTREQAGLPSRIFTRHSALYHRGRHALYQRIINQDSIRNIIVKEFQRLYYNTRERTWLNTTWLGVPIIKCPLDLWVYHEILFELRPDVVIECGTSKGGSALFLSSICELVGHGQVITVDLYPKPNRPEHERLTYLSGSSTDPQTIQEVTRRIRDADKESAAVLVILDSDHSREHVLDELRLYAPLVTTGSYLIVEDTQLNGHPVWPDFGPGPMEAVDIFLSENDDFVIDTTKEKFYLTWNPRGYLKRVKGGVSGNIPG